MSNSFNERLANLSKQIYEEELRMDPTDFEEYTQAEFLEFYGGLDEWKYARRVRKGEKRPMVCAIDPAHAKHMKEAVFVGFLRRQSPDHAYVAREKSHHHTL